MYQNKVLNHISTKFPKFFSVHELNKIKKERHAGGLIKGQKSPKAQKCAKWHGSEEQMNISVYHMLQSSGVQAGSYSKTEVKNETHLPGLKRVILTLRSWFPLMIKSRYICHLGNPNI